MDSPAPLRPLIVSDIEDVILDSQSIPATPYIQKLVTCSDSARICLATNAGQKDLTVITLRINYHLKKHFPDHANMFDVIITRDTFGRGKDDPEYWDGLSETANQPTTTILFIDNNITNVMAAREKGVEAVHHQGDFADTHQQMDAALERIKPRLQSLKL